MPQAFGFSRSFPLGEEVLAEGLAQQPTRGEQGNVRVSDRSIRGDRQKGDVETLPGKEIESPEHRGMLDIGADDMPAGVLARDALDRQVIGFAAGTGEEYLGRRDAQTRRHPFPCPMDYVIGDTGQPVGAAGVPERARILEEIAQRIGDFCADRCGCVVVQIDLARVFDLDQGHRLAAAAGGQDRDPGPCVDRDQPVRENLLQRLPAHAGVSREVCVKRPDAALAVILPRIFQYRHVSIGQPRAG